MGIGDDIKFKKTKPEESKIEELGQTNEESAPQLSGEEIPIDKSKTAEPVYEDLLPKTARHFENSKEDDGHNKLEKPSSLSGIVGHETPISQEEDKDELEEQPVPREDSFKSFAEYHEKQPHHKSHLLTIIIILFVLLLATLLILQNLDQIKELVGIKSEVSNSEKPITSGVEIIGRNDISPTNSTAPVNNTTAPTTAPTTGTPSNTTGADTATSTPSNSATPASNLASLKVRVLNGNGIAGSAATVKNKLVAAGYAVGNVTNAARFTYTKTIIYFNTGKQAEATAVATVLADRQTETILNTSVVGTNDLVIVVGKN